MGTRGWDINGRNPDFDSFMGIAHGVTEFNIKLKQSKRNRKTTNKPTNAGDIKKALGYYYGYYNDNEGNATIPPMWYITQVWANFNRIRRGVIFKRYVGGNEYDPNSGEIVTEYQN